MYTISKKVICANSYLVRQYIVIWAYHSKTPNGILYTICCKNLLLLSSLQRKWIRQGKEKTKKVGDYFFFVFSCSSSVCANFHLDRVYKYSTACWLVFYWWLVCVFDIDLAWALDRQHDLRRAWPCMLLKVSRLSLMVVHFF